MHAGLVAESFVHPGGDQLITRFAPRGSLLALEEMLAGVPLGMDLLALTDGVVVTLKRDALSGPLSEARHAARLNRYLAQRTMRYRSRLVDFAYGSLESRVAMVLLEIGDSADFASPPVTQEMIAHAVGASRPKVNRCLRGLQWRGILTWRQGRAPLIRDIGALKRLATLDG